MFHHFQQGGGTLLGDNDLACGGEPSEATDNTLYLSRQGSAPLRSADRLRRCRRLVVPLSPCERTFKYRKHAQSLVAWRGHRPGAKRPGFKSHLSQSLAAGVSQTTFPSGNPCSSSIK